MRYQKITLIKSLKKDIGPNENNDPTQNEGSNENKKKQKSRVPKDHPISNVIGDIEKSVVTRRRSRLNEVSFTCYTSQLEQKNVEEALGDESWTTALQEELNQFIRNDVCYLVPRPKDKHMIGTKWIFKNKLDENGVIVRNKVRLVA